MPRGYYVEDYVYEMTKFIIEHLPVEVALFDRGFGSWGVIYRLKKLKDGEAIRINREGNYKRFKSYFKVNSHFVLILI